MPNTDILLVNSGANLWWILSLFLAAPEICIGCVRHENGAGGALNMEEVEEVEVV